MKSIAEIQPAYLAQATHTPSDGSLPMVAGGGTLIIGVLAFLAKWGFTQLSNDLKDKITGLHGSIEKLTDTQQRFSLEYVRKVEFEREILKLETQTENAVSRMEIKLEKLGDKIEQLLIKERES
jgi:hypothetical protein